MHGHIRVQASAGNVSTLIHLIQQCIYKKWNLLFPACLAVAAVWYDTAGQMHLSLKQESAYSAVFLYHVVMISYFV